MRSICSWFERKPRVDLIYRVLAAGAHEVPRQVYYVTCDTPLATRHRIAPDRFKSDHFERDVFDLKPRSITSPWSRTSHQSTASGLFKARFDMTEKEMILIETCTHVGLYLGSMLALFHLTFLSLCLFACLLFFFA
jgi:hypothetical protein